MRSGSSVRCHDPGFYGCVSGSNATAAGLVLLLQFVICHIAERAIGPAPQAVNRISKVELNANWICFPAACPRNSRWLLVTNGDNEYDPNFLKDVIQHQDVDVLAYDYYSRFQRPTGKAWDV